MSSGEKRTLEGESVVDDDVVVAFFLGEGEDDVLRIDLRFFLLLWCCLLLCRLGLLLLVAILFVFVVVSHFFRLLVVEVVAVVVVVFVDGGGGGGRTRPNCSLWRSIFLAIYSWKVFSLNALPFLSVRNIYPRERQVSSEQYDKEKMSIHQPTQTKKT